MEMVTVSTVAAPLVVHPTNRVEEIMQNVRMIFATRRGTVPLDRDFGLDHGVVDKPIDVAKVYLMVDAYQQIRKYEPRAWPERFEFDDNLLSPLDGTLTARVLIRIEDDK